MMRKRLNRGGDSKLEMMKKENGQQVDLMHKEHVGVTESQRGGCSCPPVPTMKDSHAAIKGPPLPSS